MADTLFRQFVPRVARIGAGRASLCASLLVMLAVVLAGMVPRLSFGQAAQATPAAPVTSVAPSSQAAPVAKPGPRRVDAVEAELVADVARAAPGEPFRLGLRLAHDPHWHTYWRNPGDSGLPTRFEPTGPAGADYGDIAWPAPRRLAIGNLANYGYEGELILAREVVLPTGFDAATARFEVHAQWLVCKDVCIPGEAALALELPVGPQVQPAAPRLAKLFDASASDAPQASARIEAGWWQQDARAMLLLPEGMAAGRVEFFPYFEGIIRPAAPQSLRDGGRLALELETVATAEGGVPAPPAGVLLLDGTAVEVGLQPLASEPAAGKVLSVAEVAPSAPPAGRSLLDRLRGGSGGESAPAASATGVGAQATAAARPFPSPAIGAASGTLTIALAGALLGGLILNLMPCVFPVIGLKVLSFSQAAAGSTRTARRHALSFSAGVVLAFLSLGMIMLALRFAGEAAGWGFQMQSPVFVGAMALLFVLIGLNLFGVFEAGVLLTRLTPAPSGRGEGLGSSFGTGVVAVLVATPCTAPFMGSAVGYTLGSPPLQTLLVFATLGIGMALPYLVLGWAPGLLRRLPRPGGWLLVFKQLLAFPMLATAAWLAWVLTLQAGADGLLRLLMAAILLAFAAWVYGRAQQAALGGRGRPGLVGFAAAAVAGTLTLWQLAQIGAMEPAANTVADAGSASPAAAVSANASNARPLGVPGAPGGLRASEEAMAASTSSNGSGGPGESSDGPQWQPWSAEKVSQSLAQGRPVLVDFTAAWCISCQANKKLVLERDVVRRAFEARDVTLLRADWTRRDPAITAALASFGRNGVPLYLVYHSADQLPLMLPELLTVDIVLAALADGR